MNIPKVSIITICRNAENCIAGTIESVLEQDYKDLEYIVIDGASSDETLTIISQYTDRVKYISESDLGIYDAMNKGIECASGEWLLFMNAGDRFWDSSTISKFADYLTEEYSAVFGNTYFSNGKIHKANIDKKLSFIHQSVFYKKSMHKKYGSYLVYPMLTTADYAFIKILYKNEKTFTIDEYVSKYDVNGISSKSDTFIQTCIFEYINNDIGAARLSAYLLFYPIYRAFKKILL